MENYAKIGIVGGTFNPFHNAHLFIALHFQQILNLNRVFFVPANISPFKTDDPSINLISNNQRLKMLEFGIKGYPLFEIDTYELDKEGISYSVDTVKNFRLKFPQSELFLLIGDDQAAEFNKWKDCGQILNLVQVCVANRTKSLSEQVKFQIDSVLTSGKKTPIWIENQFIDISSSMIREFVQKGFDVQDLIPKQIELYIQENNLYR